MPNVGASLKSRDVRKSYVIAEGPLALCNLPRCNLPRRRLAVYHLSPLACSTEK